MTQHFEGKQSDRTRSTRSTGPTRSPDSPRRSSEPAAKGVSLRELDSPMISHDAMLRLQRTLGNRAVTELLRSRSTTAPLVARAPLLQRNGETQQVMEYLATPRTYELKMEEIAVQGELAQQLDAAIAGDIKAVPHEVVKLEEERAAASEKQTKLLAKQLNTDDPHAPLLQEDWRQDRLHALKSEINALDKGIKQKRANRMSYDDATFIGAIILKDKVGTIKELIGSAQLVDLPSVNDKEATVKQSLAGSAYHLVRKEKLAPRVISNTLVTMETARQLEYFRKAGLPNEKYVILVEVHYYRDRPTSATKLHKDTKGETLFVNLSFTNKKAVLGPEYIVNPASNAIYDQFVKQKLPEVFVDDLEAVRRNFKGKKIIEATVLQANGVVAFVDEAIHHKTPTVGPRTASTAGLKEALAYVYQDEYRDAKKAYERYDAASTSSRKTSASAGDGPPPAPPRWSSYLTNPAALAHAKPWFELHKKLAELETTRKELNRAQLKQWLPGYFTDRADEILEQAATDFTSVSFSHLGPETLTVPVRERGSGRWNAR